MRGGTIVCGMGLMLLLASVQAADPASGVGRPAVAARLAEATEVRKRLGLSPEFDRTVGAEKLSIAVLDFGFAGIDGRRPYLPANHVIVEHYDPEFVRKHDLGDPGFQRPFAEGNSHGRTMAQIVWAMTGFHPAGPRFYLLNANGPTLFRRAVRYAMEQRVDVILFSAVFEGAGNGEGRGFINRAVAEATSAGIIWVNAAGNFGKKTHEGPIRFGAGGYVTFGNSASPNALRFRNRLDENTITLTLTWNDYRETEDAGTNKDLDLYVEDAMGRPVSSSTLVQVEHPPVQSDQTRNPRERLVLADLAAGEYRIRIRAKSTEPFAASDQFRVLMAAERDEAPNFKTGETIAAVDFMDANGRGEIYPPADNPLVITVGDASDASSSGATADHRRKPDVTLNDSRATFTNGLTTTGSSNAAAYFAGMVLVFKAAEPGLETRHLLTLAHPPTAVRTTGSTTRLVRLANGTLVRVGDQRTNSTRPTWRTPTLRELSNLVQSNTR